MTTDLTTTPRPEGTRIVAASPYDRIASLVLDTVSERTRRDYGRALRDFMQWHVTTGQAGLSKATVQAHIAHLKAIGVTDSSINQRLAAIRKLANEAADYIVGKDEKDEPITLLPESVAQSIGRVANIKRQGRKLGNWLNKEQASAMLNAPDARTLKGKRDRAILAVMLGAGLRREEVVSLTVAHLAQRDARWVILNLVGKHNRVRTIPIASWVKVAIDKWTAAAAITTGPLFRPVLKGSRLQPGRMTAQAVWDVVQQYSPVPGLAPHDLRRTFAKLADKGGSPLAQIQRTLGHASIQTTERYIGYELDLQNAPSDYVQLEFTP